MEGPKDAENTPLSEEEIKALEAYSANNAKDVNLDDESWAASLGEWTKKEAEKKSTQNEELGFGAGDIGQRVGESDNEEERKSEEVSGEPEESSPKEEGPTRMERIREHVEKFKENIKARVSRKEKDSVDPEVRAISQDIEELFKSGEENTPDVQEEKKGWFSWLKRGKKHTDEQAGEEVNLEEEPVRQQAHGYSGVAAWEALSPEAKQERLEKRSELRGKLEALKIARTNFVVLEREVNEKMREEGHAVLDENYEAAKLAYRELWDEYASGSEHREGKEENRYLKEQELLNNLDDIGEEVDAMSEEEKEKLGKGFSHWGYIVEEKKNKAFENVFKHAANRAGEKTTLSRFFGALEKNSHQKVEKAHQSRLQIDKGDTRRLSSTGYIMGNVLKYGRTAADVVGWTAGSPLRYVMLGAQGFSSVSAAGREARLQNEELIEKTRVDDEERAAEEAWALYEKTKAENGGLIPSSEKLQETYRQNLPKDIIERLSRNENGGVISFLGSFVRKDVELEMGRVQKKLDKIESDKSLSNEQKKVEVGKLLTKMSGRLGDYDRMITDAGTVDAWAMGARYAETAGKAVIGGVMAETVLMAVDKLQINKQALTNIWERAGKIFAETEAPIIDTPEPSEKVFGVPAGGVEELAEEEIVLPPDTLEVLPGGDISSSLEDVGAEAQADVASEKLVGTVRAGGNAWLAATDLVKSGAITQEQLTEAWTNPASVSELPSGERIHIAERGLTHEGDQVRYIPGTGTERGRFEFTDNLADKMHSGSHEDLAQAFDKAGKPRPEWLQKALGSTGDVVEATESPKLTMKDLENAKFPEPEVVSGVPAPEPYLETVPEGYISHEKAVEKASEGLLVSGENVSKHEWGSAQFIYDDKGNVAGVNFVETITPLGRAQLVEKAASQLLRPDYVDILEAEPNAVAQAKEHAYKLHKLRQLFDATEPDTKEWYALRYDLRQIGHMATTRGYTVIDGVTHLQPEILNLTRIIP